MDIQVERRMDASPEAVARVMFDPSRDPEWIAGAKAVEPLADGPMGVGVQVRRHGGFVGRRFSWVTEVTGFEPNRRLEMRFVEGPMKGGVSYEIRPDGRRSVVAIRNHGGAGFSVPGLSWMLRRAVAGDLRRLAALVELVQR